MTLANKPDFEYDPIVQPAVGHVPWHLTSLTQKRQKSANRWWKN
ncbi:hypothetical protein VIOR103205_06410 [Vibrio ordalii]|nr:hypothetical protein [Vibrio ordalii]